MLAHDQHTPPRCLSDCEVGDLVQVRLIVFELVRSRCWHLPLREGDLLRHMERSDEGVMVSRLDGTTVTVPHECARFIGVELVSTGKRPAPSPARHRRGASVRPRPARQP